jgi:hypothetical protein
MINLNVFKQSSIFLLWFGLSRFLGAQVELKVTNVYRREHLKRNLNGICKPYFIDETTEAERDRVTFVISITLPLTDSLSPAFNKLDFCDRGHWVTQWSTQESCSSAAQFRGLWPNHFPTLHPTLLHHHTATSLFSIYI